MCGFKSERRLHNLSSEMFNTYIFILKVPLQQIIDESTIIIAGNTFTAKAHN